MEGQYIRKTWSNGAGFEDGGRSLNQGMWAHSLQEREKGREEMTSGCSTALLLLNFRPMKPILDF